MTQPQQKDEPIDKLAQSVDWAVSRLKSAERMAEALNEIQKGIGPFSKDRLEHATGTIESMKDIAKQALDLWNETS